MSFAKKKEHHCIESLLQSVANLGFEISVSPEIKSTGNQIHLNENLSSVLSEDMMTNVSDITINTYHDFNDTNKKRVKMRTHDT